ncbi:MAG: sigma 54-interacting transcriptional regulator [Spirochaetaceae bacterium]
MNNCLYLPEKLITQLNQIAKSDATLLLLGESGVGKEIIANRVHTLSTRNKIEPIIINIAAIPADLLERELFGSVKGAFTGSESDYIGVFKRAHKSTLILDEIAEIPLTIQGKLLNVLEYGVIQPIGSNESFKVDCRIIAITNKDVNEQIEKGLFRKDLYYRLNVITFNVPPLRNRVQFIKQLIFDLIGVFSSENEKYSISDEALSQLISYHWPGNIRELSNTIERAITLSNNSEITSENLLLSSDNNVNISSATLKEAVDHFKKNYIMKVLEFNGWNVTKSAKILGIQRTYLSRLIKELYMDERNFT